MSNNRLKLVTNTFDSFLDFLYFMLRVFLRPIIKTIWVREVTGLDRILMKGGAIVAMNHQSYFDFLCLAAIFPRNIHFLAAEKFFDHWLWKHLMKVTRQVRVNRRDDDKTEVHRIVHDHLENNRVIGIFPEGTRSPHEYEMLKAFTGVAKYSLIKRVPIIPIGIIGTFKVMSKNDKKPHLIKVVEIHVGNPIYLTEYHSRKDYTHIDYRVVTHKVMKEISILSKKNYSHEQ